MIRKGAPGAYRNFLSPDEKANALALWDAKQLTGAEIADKIGCCEMTVYNIAQAAGRPGRRGTIRPKKARQKPTRPRTRQSIRYIAKLRGLGEQRKVHA